MLCQCVPFLQQLISTLDCHYSKRCSSHIKVIRGPSDNSTLFISLKMNLTREWVTPTSWQLTTPPCRPWRCFNIPNENFPGTESDQVYLRSGPCKPNCSHCVSLHLQARLGGVKGLSVKTVCWWSKQESSKVSPTRWDELHVHALWALALLFSMLSLQQLVHPVFFSLLEFLPPTSLILES